MLPTTRRTDPPRNLFPIGLAVLALGAAPAFAQAPATPLARLPYTPGLDTGAMDRSADPCVDFYRYACGGWQAANPIPPDQASWDVYRKMAEANERFLWGILDSLARRTRGRDATQAKMATTSPHGRACDRGARQRAARALPRAHRGPRFEARLHLANGDAGLLFGFGSAQDYADATRVIAFASAGGLGLPDRDYYTRRRTSARRRSARSTSRT